MTLLFFAENWFPVPSSKMTMFRGAPPTVSIASPTRSEGVEGVGPNWPGKGEGRFGGVEGVKCGVGRDEADARRGPLEEPVMGTEVDVPCIPNPTAGEGLPVVLPVLGVVAPRSPEMGRPSTTSAMVGRPALAAAIDDGEGRRWSGTKGEVGERGEEADR
jgi:hypothetical protein